MNRSVGKIQELREATGAPVMDCKKALEEAHGDFERAVELIKKSGLLKAAKRAERETRAGLIESYVHRGRIGVLLDLRAETDFVVNSDPFRELAHELAMHIAAASPETVEELLTQPYIRDEAKPVEHLIKEVSAKVGENIQVNKFYRLEL